VVTIATLVPFPSRLAFFDQRQIVSYIP
jgi:hypothetical protein